MPPKKTKTTDSAAKKVCVVQVRSESNIRAGVAVELPPMFRYDPVPERRVRSALEAVMPDYRAVLARL